MLACACVLTEVLQAAIGGFLHRHMAISHAGIRPGASLVYLSYGSTVLWLHCYALFSWLPFRLLLVQQGAAAAVLLAWSPSMCASSPGLQVGYRTLHGLLPRRLKVWVARLCLGFWQPAACAAVPALGTAGAGGAAALAAAADSDVALCMHYQPTALLLFGFIASTWLAWCGEVRQRTGFLQRTLLRQQPGEEGRRAASAGDEQACLRREAAAELAAGVPSGWDFFMFYAAPILVCLFLVERCLWADAALPLYN